MPVFGFLNMLQVNPVSQKYLSCHRGGVLISLNNLSGDTYQYHISVSFCDSVKREENNSFIRCPR